MSFVNHITRIARDRDLCDKSQNVSRKSAYIYAKKYSIYVDFSSDKNQIFSRLCCVHREECFEKCFQIMKKIQSDESFSRRVRSTF